MRQGRFNSNYKQPIKTINLLHRDEMEQAMNIEEGKLWELLLMFNAQYMRGTYPTRIDCKVMYDKIMAKRKERDSPLPQK